MISAKKNGQISLNVTSEHRIFTEVDQQQHYSRSLGPLGTRYI